MNDIEKKYKRLVHNFRDHFDIIKAWVKDQGISVSGLGNVFKDGEDVSDRITNYGMLNVWYQQQQDVEAAYREEVAAAKSAEMGKTVKSDPIRKLSEKELSGAFVSMYIHAIMKHSRQLVADKIKHDASAPQDLVYDFVERITGNRSSLDVCAFRHWMWQAKRGIMRMPVTGQMMLVLVGLQGKFKSKVAALIGRELGEFLVTSQVGDVFGSFAGKDILAQAGVVVFDELDGVTKTDMLTIKNTITAGKIRSRPLYSNSLVERTLRAAMIGTSNSSVDIQLQDPTGMRRFWQVNMSNLTPAQYKDLEENFDFIGMWKSIDESRPDGYYLDEKEAMNKVQNEMRTATPLEEFFEDHNVSRAKIEEAVGRAYTVNLKKGDLLRLYSIWMKEHGQKWVPNPSTFGKMCLEILGKDTDVKFYVDNIQYRGLRINGDHGFREPDGDKDGVLGPMYLPSLSGTNLLSN